MFHKLTIQSVTKVSPQAVAVSFDIPNSIASQFDYIQGQYVTLELEVAGQKHRRSYSICSSKYHQEPLTIAVKRVAGGLISNVINDVFSPGVEVNVMEPMGNFHTSLHPSNQVHYYLIAGGSGITPMMSILKSVLFVEPQSQITLVYANQSKESIIFFEDLNALQQQYNSRLKIIHVLEQADSIANYNGLLSKELAISVFNDLHIDTTTRSEFFICGPGPMMENAKNALIEKAIQVDRIHIEYFSAKDPSLAQSIESGTNDDQAEITSGTSKVIIKYDGRVCEFEMNVKNTVLEAALDAGYDPPYSCMVAACCTCRAKIIKGKVHMDDRESLTDGEIKDGYVLTCQSHPRTAIVELDFDM